MRPVLIAPILIALPLAAGGCVAKAVVNVATAPIRATGQVVDWTTTSQEEADRNRGRAMREAEEECRDRPDRCPDGHPAPDRGD